MSERLKKGSVMPDRRSLVFVLIALALVSTLSFGQVQQHRPIQDFLNAQTTPSLWWVNSANPQFQAQVDYAGYFSKYLIDNGGPNLGTQLNGDIIEKLLPDGRTRVSIVIQGKSIFMRARLVSEDPYYPHVFGYGPGEIISGGWPAATGHCTFTIEFINNKAIGGDLPDLRQLSYTPEPGQELVSILVNGYAQGPLRSAFGVPEGTRGYLHVMQRGLLKTGQGIPGQDTYPVEQVRVGVLGSQP